MTERAEGERGEKKEAQVGGCLERHHNHKPIYVQVYVSKSIWPHASV